MLPLTPVVLWFLSAALAQAAPKCNGGVALPQSISLEPVTSQELVVSSPGLAVRLNEITAIPALPSIIRRTLPAIWESEIAADGSAGAVTVEYELMGTNGCQNCLSHSQSPEALVQATLEALPITLENKPGNGKNCRKISSGVNLLFDLKSAHYAGTYQGQLRVTITRL